MPFGIEKNTLLGAGAPKEYTYTKDHVVGGYAGYILTNEVFTAITNSYAVGTAYSNGTDVGYFDHAQTINGKTGMGYLPGGAVRTSGGSSENTAVSKSYGFSTDAFSALTAMTVAISAGATSIIDDDIIVSGGRDSRTCNNFVDDCYQYSIAGDSWSTRSDFGDSRKRMMGQGFGMQVKDGVEHFNCGGMNANCHPTYAEVNYVDRFTPSTNAWDTRQALPVTSAKAFQSGMGDYIYSQGGDLAGAGRDDNTYRYSPGSNSWATRTSSAATQQGGWCYPIINGGDTFLYTQAGDVGGNQSDQTNYYSESANAWTSQTTLASPKRWDP